MARETLTFSIHIEGAKPILAAFNRLPKEASKDLRARTLELSKVLADKVAAAARAEGGQAAALASTVKANSDRVPSITAGGSKRVTFTRVPASKLIFGSEFGANRRTGWYAAARYNTSTGRQYKPHLGAGSYWFFRTVEENEADISSAWLRVANDIVHTFMRDGA